MLLATMAAWQQWLFKTKEGAELVERALFHEIQHYTAQYLEALAHQVRELKTAEDCFILQKELLGILFRVEQIEDGCTKLLRTGSADLDIRAKQFAAGRGARQLRTVGDALAWMVLGGNRRAVIALLQNEQPGRIHGKGERGLQAEMNVVNACWHRDGHFALLHDSTNILRIDDGTVCNRLHRTDVKQGHDGCPEADYGLFEVKANRRAKPSPEQKQRHQAALAAINEGADIKTKAGFRRQFQWQDGYDSHQDQLSQVLDRAMSDGHGAAQLEEGWVISAVRFVSTDAAASGKPIEDIVDPWQEMQDQLVAKAGFADRPQLKVHSGDAAGRLLKCLPYALFPMSERAYAFLTSDWLVMSSVLSLDYLEARLQAVGVKTERIDDSKGTIRLSSGDHAITTSRSSIEDILLEGITIDTWAKAMAAWAAEPGFEGQGELVLDLR